MGRKKECEFCSRRTSDKKRNLDVNKDGNESIKRCESNNVKDQPARNMKLILKMCKLTGQVTPTHLTQLTAIISGWQQGWPLTRNVTVTLRSLSFHSRTNLGHSVHSGHFPFRETHSTHSICDGEIEVKFEKCTMDDWDVFQKFFCPITFENDWSHGKVCLVVLKWLFLMDVIITIMRLLLRS